MTIVKLNSLARLGGNLSQINSSLAGKAGSDNRTIKLNSLARLGGKLVVVLVCVGAGWCGACVPSSGEVGSEIGVG